MHGQICFMVCFIVINIGDFVNANICASFNDPICESFNDPFCSPIIDFDRKCNCALVRYDQLKNEWEYLKKTSGTDLENVQPKIRLLQLPITVIDQLNRFFADDQTAKLDPEIFTNVSTEFSFKMIALPRARFAITKICEEFINQYAPLLSEVTRSTLCNCNNAICEQIGRFTEVIAPRKKVVNVIPMEKSVAVKIDDILERMIADREFKAEKVVRVEFGDNVLLAFSASKSTFSLTKTKNNTKREFTDALLAEWKQFANAQLVKSFRTHYGRMMV